MDIIVCIKQVPDIAEIAKVKTDPETGTIIREGVPSVVNPFDEFAVEEAVRVKERLEEDVNVTVITMGTGSVILLITGFVIEGLPLINMQSWGIILWLALVNTAFAFTLWNHTLRTLTAMESSIINGTMMVWIPIFAILFLGETITGKEIIGLITVGVGTLIVQLRSRVK